MTQAFNLSQFANSVDSSGKASLTTGVTGTLPVANGGTGTTTPGLVGGTNISVSGTWPNQTITNTSSASGTVTSVATGNGLSGGTITTSGTLTLACPSSGSVGSYAIVSKNTWQPLAGNTYSGMTGRCWAPDGGIIDNGPATSGTWRVMGSNSDRNDIVTILCCRVS